MADLFEEYKEALKKGHVAVLRGALEEAIVHYQAAAAIAADRPLPHSSLGGVLLRLGRTEEAISAYDEAVSRGPGDETALSGRSDALLAAGRRAEAAEVLDTLARVQLEKGREPEALATRGLARAVRAAGGIAEPDGDPLGGLERAASDEEASTEADVSAEPESAGEPEAPATAAELIAAAQTAVDEARTADAVDAYVRAAVAYGQESAIDAGLDACQQALALSPGSPDVHLTLARLYFVRGWQDRAAEKLVLLDRLLGLDGPNGWQQPLAELVAAHASEDHRLAQLSTRQTQSLPLPAGE
jgi:tetratricopeptide (TPR) repeat protein